MVQFDSQKARPSVIMSQSSDKIVLQVCTQFSIYDLYGDVDIHHDPNDHAVYAFEPSYFGDIMPRVSAARSRSFYLCVIQVNVQCVGSQGRRRGRRSHKTTPDPVDVL